MKGIIKITFIISLIFVLVLSILLIVENVKAQEEMEEQPIDILQLEFFDQDNNFGIGVGEITKMDLMIVKQDYIDSLIVWELNQINKTYWNVTGVIDRNFWSNATYCRDLISAAQKRTCFMNVCNNFLNDTIPCDATHRNMILSDIANFSSYPLTNLTPRMIFKNRNINLTSGTISFLLELPERLVVGDTSILGFGSTTVSVTANTIYRVSGNDGTYSIDFHKNNTCGTIGCTGDEINYTIYGNNFPSSRVYKSITTSTTGLLTTAGNAAIVESGPARVMMAFSNTTGNFVLGNTQINWTEYVYAYPKHYQNYYTAVTNNSFGWGAASSDVFSVYRMNPYATNNPQFDEWNNRTAGGVAYSFSVDVGAGADVYNLDINSVAFLYDDANTNKSLLYHTTFSTLATPNKYVCQSTLETIQMGYWSSVGAGAGTRTLGYMVMFGQNGNRTVAGNQTVWNLDFEEQYKAWYNPATMTAITGTQQGRNNLTGSYNYIANGNLADFNFTTVAGMNYTYPVFEVRNVSNITNIINHMWWKNYTASSDWVQLTNWTEFIIQKGNSSFFGYDYVVILFNKTFGRETSNTETYEFWISNLTDPVGGEIDATFSIAMPGSYTSWTTISGTTEETATATDWISFNFTDIPQYWVQPYQLGDASKDQNGASEPIFYIDVTGNTDMDFSLRFSSLPSGIAIMGNASCSGTYTSCQSAVQNIQTSYVQLINDLSQTSSFGNITLYGNLSAGTPPTGTGYTLYILGQD